jgi:hypothetical protein
MFNPSREQVRRFFCDTWKKQQHHQPLAGAEIAAAEIMQRHPEYHALLNAPEVVLNQEWTPEEGQMNPFLHLSLHLAIHEQIAIDQPPGIRRNFDLLRMRLDAHPAEHVILEALGETIWEAQQKGGPMDAEAYVARIERQVKG